MKNIIKSHILKEIEKKGSFYFATPWGIKAVLDAALELEKERLVTVFVTLSSNNDCFIAVSFIERSDISGETADYIDSLLKIK